MCTFTNKSAFDMGGGAAIVRAVAEKLCKMGATKVQVDYRGADAYCRHRLAVQVYRPVRVIVAIALLVFNLALLTACGDDKTADVSNRDGTINVLLTSKAGGGSFEKLDNGNHRLTLHDVAPSTSYSAEQSEPLSGETSTKTFIDEYQWDTFSLPNAAVIITDPAAPTNQNVMIVKLMTPVYDEALATLSFDMLIDRNYQGNYLTPYIADADASLPATFGSTSVIVDSIWHHSCSRGYISCYRHYGCCNQPTVTQPLGNIKVNRCWSWSHLSCQPCSEDPCAAQFPKDCSNGNCYDSCSNDEGCSPT